MTLQGHVTTASLKEAHKEDNRDNFLSVYIERSSAHPIPSLKVPAVNLGTLNIVM